MKGRPVEFNPPGVDQQIDELMQARWRPWKTHTVWISPWGGLYRGPYGAWKTMMRLKRQAQTVNP